MRRHLGAIAALSFVVLFPTALYAQASITGTVQDASGAVLPGVTVEAASPELIEKVRTTVTDASGLYRIENLRPGLYSVTFTLPGFSTVKRDGLELSGTFVATVNAELKVGAIEETITVTGETPIVDVQSATPADGRGQGRSSRRCRPPAGYSSLLALVPGIVGGTRDVQTGPCACTFSAHGALLAGRSNGEGRTMLDGLLISVPQGSSSNYIADTRNAQEISFTVSGSLGETETGGPVLNIVPKAGGNNLSGSFYAGKGPQSLQGSNYSEELRAQGLEAADAADQELRLQRRRRRADSPGPVVVLHERPDAGQLAVRVEHLLQPERRQPQRVDLLAGQEPAGLPRPHLGQRQPAADGAGHPAQQTEPVLGRAAHLPQVQERRQPLGPQPPRPTREASSRSSSSRAPGRPP